MRARSARVWLAASAGGGVLDRAGEGVVIVHRDAPRATHGDRLQVLGPHHGADAGAPGGPVEVVHHAGVAVQVLPGAADGGDLDGAVLMARLDRGLGIPDRFAPDEALGVDQLGVVVLDVEVDRARRAALADHHIPAGELQLPAEVAARVRAGDGVGERPLGDDGVTPGRRRRGPGQRAGCENEDVFGRERVRLRVHLLDDILGGKAPAAQIGLRPLHVERLFGAGACTEVNPQQSALPRHRIPPAVDRPSRAACGKPTLGFGVRQGRGAGENGQRVCAKPQGSGQGPGKALQGSRRRADHRAGRRFPLPSPRSTRSSGPR